MNKRIYVLEDIDALSEIVSHRSKKSEEEDFVTVEKKGKDSDSDSDSDSEYDEDTVKEQYQNELDRIAKCQDERKCIFCGEEYAMEEICPNTRCKRNTKAKRSDRLIYLEDMLEGIKEDKEEKEKKEKKKKLQIKKARSKKGKVSSVKNCYEYGSAYERYLIQNDKLNLSGLLNALGKFFYNFIIL